MDQSNQNEQTDATTDANNQLNQYRIKPRIALIPKRSTKNQTRIRARNYDIHERFSLQQITQNNATHKLPHANNDAKHCHHHTSRNTFKYIQTNKQQPKTT